MPNRMPVNGELLRVGGKIKVSKNGPYFVSGEIPLSTQTIGIDAAGYSYEWREGKIYPSRESYALCRCGRSKTKPFCDGTHTKIHFDGKEKAGRESYLRQARNILGPALDLTDAEALCAEARFCDRAGGTWKLTSQSDDPNARVIAIQEAGLCPSGRLVVWDKEGKPIEPSFELSIVVVEDHLKNMEGPIWVRDGIPIESADGYTYELRNRITLCRCGKSRNKPFCDGSH
ncbi:CDGSH iron-sulfur domain-containing protein [Chloroflexota bacterium]